MSELDTTLERLPESRARIDVTVPAAEVERELEQAATALANEMKVPGFRKGKVPPQLVLQKVGRDAVMEQALRNGLPDWYERALIEAGISPVGDPELDVSEMPGPGEALAFSVEVGTRPEATLGEWRGLEVGRAAAEVPEEAVDQEVERLRQSLAKLTTVDRPAADGDFLLIDYEGTVDGESFEGSSGSDTLIELGSERLIEGFTEALRGASAGDEREVTTTFPDDHESSALAGKEAVFKITVKEVREQELPELDDEFASDAAGFESLGELREDITERLRPSAEHQAEEEFRRAALDAAVESSDVDVPEPIARARAEEMWARMERSLAQQGIDGEAFAQAQGKTREEMIEQAMDDARQALKREAVLAAIADAAGVEVTEQDMLEALTPDPGHEHHDHDHEHEDPEKLLAKLRQSGRDKVLEGEIRLRKAADALVEEANPIPLGQAEARDALWTPEKGAAEEAGEGEGKASSGEGGSGKLWTPGSG